jgi:hypothetical protein
MTCLLCMAGGILVVLAGLSRCSFLARGKAGWTMYLANVAWEAVSKKTRIPRFLLEPAAAATGLLLLGLAGGDWSRIGAWALVLLALEALHGFRMRRWLAEAEDAGCILTVEAPLMARWPSDHLGVRWAGVPFDIELVVLNPSRNTLPGPLRARLVAPGGWLADANADRSLAPLESGGVGRMRWTLCPGTRQGGGELVVEVESSEGRRHIRIGHDGCRFASETRIVRAGIARYPGGRRSAFAWRGDMDLYDVRTFQSIEGLETTLGLAARYAFPQTMCLSTRLSLDENAAREWAAHTGSKTGWEEISRFIQWMKDKVDLCHAAPYPARGAGKPYVLELGNHGHLHYDTAAAAAPENSWKSHAKMGAGRYPWMGGDVSSFGEQRDNLLEAARWFGNCFGFVPRSWAKPGRCNDADTARAAEAAGCEVLSGSDIRARDNVLFQPPPHHPGGTGAVELTSRYPPDPVHSNHAAMLLFWLHRSQRLDRPMVYMCHQHMRQWEGDACSRITERLLRAVLADSHGEFYIDTLFGVGKYWREVLSPKTRRVAVRLDGTRLHVDNRSDWNFDRLPVDVELDDGSRSTVLVDVPSGQAIEVDLKG